MTQTATGRALNFSAGPATLPEPVLEQAGVDLWDIADSGIGICEHSHRDQFLIVSFMKPLLIVEK